MGSFAAHSDVTYNSGMRDIMPADEISPISETGL
jgi:hypothetical protein